MKNALIISENDLRLSLGFSIDVVQNNQLTKFIRAAQDEIVSNTDIVYYQERFFKEFNEYNMI